MQQPRKERKYIWYIEPRNIITNDTIARLLEQEVVATDFLSGQVCHDGWPHDLWRLPHFKHLALLELAKVERRLSYRVFNAIAGAKPREVTQLVEKMFPKKKSAAPTPVLNDNF